MSVKQASRIVLTKEDLENLSKEDLIKKWKLQDSYLDALESKTVCDAYEQRIQELEEKLQHQKAESTRRDNILVQRLSTKMHEKDECYSQLQFLKQSIPSPGHLKSVLVDPSVKLLFDKMQTELERKKKELTETQNEMSAWKFTPDSNTGKRLMLKCRKLHQENEELGKLVASGRVAKLESELALQKSLSQEIKNSQNELDDLLLQMEENAQLMQSTIFGIQKQLKESNSEIEALKEEKKSLKDQLALLQDKLTACANQFHHSISEELDKNGSSITTTTKSSIVENHRTHSSPHRTIDTPEKEEVGDAPLVPPSSVAIDELKLPSKRTRHRTPPAVEGNGESTANNRCLKWNNSSTEASSNGTPPTKKTPKIKRTSSRTATAKKASYDAGWTPDVPPSPKRFKSSEENQEEDVSTEVQVAKTLANMANGEVEH